MIIMVFGLVRYFATQHYLLSDQFPVSRGIVFLSFVATFGVCNIVRVLSKTKAHNQESYKHGPYNSVQPVPF